MQQNFDFSFWQFLGLKYTTKSNLSFMLENGWFRTTLLYIELTSAVMDSKEPTIYICYRQISVIANIEIKEKLSKWLKNIFCYRQISITGRSVRVRFKCIWKWEPAVVSTTNEINLLALLSSTSDSMLSSSSLPGRGRRGPSAKNYRWWGITFQ